MIIGDEDFDSSDDGNEKDLENAEDENEESEGDNVDGDEEDENYEYDDLDNDVIDDEGDEDGEGVTSFYFLFFTVIFFLGWHLYLGRQNFALNQYDLSFPCNSFFRREIYIFIIGDKYFFELTL